MDLISLRKYTEIPESILSIDGENHAWAFDSQSSNLKIIDLLSSKGLPEATIPTSEGIRIKENSYIASIGTLSSAGADSAYIRTTYGVLRLSYKKISTPLEIASQRRMWHLGGYFCHACNALNIA